MKVYSHPGSTCGRKVMTVLAEKGHEVEFELVDIMKGAQKKPEFLALQPFGVVPVLDDDGFVLYESRAIIRYLDQKLPGVALTPSDAKDRARMEQWFSVEQSYVSPAAMKIIMQALFAPMQGREPDQSLIEAGKADLTRGLDVLEKALNGQEYLVASGFSLADITYMPYFAYLFAANAGDLITARPNVSAWWSRISARPSWKKVAG
ncbi:glutathione S-transferase family protein [Chondromyces crocatus]|uniref:glutathione transferase n=1 Tax=Chondromyces crocatus TaxID=52 RepID=A0A0K1ESS3_CHOCO|nr:glutathione S-transferase N-terminal domain-containing protein [Chondromyces crocatus]AKT43687.1 glutathione S-transferase [Chondromyces crocatus]